MNEPCAPAAPAPRPWTPRNPKAENIEPSEAPSWALIWDPSAPLIVVECPLDEGDAETLERAALCAGTRRRLAARGSGETTWPAGTLRLSTIDVRIRYGDTVSETWEIDADTETLAAHADEIWVDVTLVDGDRSVTERWPTDWALAAVESGWHTEWITNWTPVLAHGHAMSAEEAATRLARACFAPADTYENGPLTHQWAECKAEAAEVAAATLHGKDAARAERLARTAANALGHLLERGERVSIMIEDTPSGPRARARIGAQGTADTEPAASDAPAGGT